MAKQSQSRKISIHALREEGDNYVGWFGGSAKISIHALREEGDQLQLLCFHK